MFLDSSTTKVFRKMLTVTRARALIVAALPLFWGAAAQNLETCPGYRASNVVSTHSTLTADLSLNGPACNVYGTDMTSLKLVVEYQTGMVIIPGNEMFNTEIYDRYSSACSNLRCRRTGLSGKSVELFCSYRHRSVNLNSFYTNGSKLLSNL